MYRSSPPFLLSTSTWLGWHTIKLDEGPEEAAEANNQLPLNKLSAFKCQELSCVYCRGHHLSRILLHLYAECWAFGLCTIYNVMGKTMHVPSCITAYNMDAVNACGGSLVR